MFANVERRLAPILERRTSAPKRGEFWSKAK